MERGQMNETNEAELKPLNCPHCGGEVTFEQSHCSGENIIECFKCHYIAFYDVDWTPNQCVAAWNTRHQRSSEQAPEDQPKLLAYLEGSASRNDEVEKLEAEIAALKEEIVNLKMQASKGKTIVNKIMQDSMVVRSDGLVKIPITQGKWVTIDEADYDLVSKHRWRANNSHGTFYALTDIRKNGKRFGLTMHRLIMGTPDGVLVDHKDRNGLNNSRSNLRHCTSYENRKNAGPQKNSKTGLKGIYLKPSGRYQVTFKNQYVGTFDTCDEAVIAYNNEALRIDGEFAYLNPIKLIAKMEER